MVKIFLRKRVALCLTITFVMLCTLCLTCVERASADQIVFRNENGSGVMNSPTRPTVFSISQSFRINSVMTYHWNNGRGTKSPGSIGLRGSDGKMYGPWGATGSPGQGGVPNAFWSARPNVIIPAGTYTVVDSDASTWSQNAQSGGAGFATVNGEPAGVPAAVVQELDNKGVVKSLTPRVPIQQMDDNKGKVNLPPKK